MDLRSTTEKEDVAVVGKWWTTTGNWFLSMAKRFKQRCKPAWPDRRTCLENHYKILKQVFKCAALSGRFTTSYIQIMVSGMVVLLWYAARLMLSWVLLIKLCYSVFVALQRSHECYW